MAKKKSNIKTIVGAGVGLTVVALTPLLLLFVGVEVPVIGEAYSDALGIQIAPQGNPEGFEIPVVPQDQIDDTTDKIIEIIEEGDAVGECGFEQIDPLTGEIPSCVGVDDGTNPPACSRTDIGSPEQCEEGISPEMVEEMIEEVVEKMEDPMIDEIINMTETSNDPPIQQIIDDITSATSIKLVLDVVKIDANNNRFESTITTEIPALAFFVEDTSNIDFTNGFIEFRIDLQTFANTIIVGTGKVDLLINNQSITEGINVKVDGITDQEGRVDLLFVSPTGATSDEFLFSFEDNMDKFPIQGVTKVDLKLIDLQIQADAVNQFGLSDSIIFTMQITTNPNEIIVTDEQGGLIRIFPTDDRFIIRSSTIPVTGYSCVVGSFSGVGCTSQYCRTWTDPPRTSSIACSGAPTFRTVGTAPTPQVSGIILFENGQFLKSIAGGNRGIIFDEMLTRNTNYTITIADPSVTFDFTTPKSQKNYDFKCWSTVKVNYAITTTSLGWGKGIISYAGVCPSAEYCFAVSPNVPFFTTGVQCNFQ